MTDSEHTENELKATTRMRDATDTMLVEFGEFERLNHIFPNAPLGPRAWTALHHLHKEIGNLLEKESDNAAA